ncbi:MAG: hypothetical protein HRU20_27410 [Pseudomonadales bacterium]|nr:hypothetical protein [Pseudomonadales bacterium]
MSRILETEYQQVLNEPELQQQSVCEQEEIDPFLHAQALNNNWQALQSDVNLKGSLQQQLREQIAAEDQTSINQTDLSASAISVVEEAILSPELNKSALDEKLNTLFDRQCRVYAEANIPKMLRTRQYICASGLVISPDHSITTIRDTLRVRAFMRGIDQGLKQLRQRFSGQLHIAYPACGPFAPLLLPLLSYYKQQGLYSSQDITVTLVDIQEGAVMALSALVKAQGVEEYIQEIVCTDASEFKPQKPVHMVVLEAMQHGFSREGHFVLAKHYAKLMVDDGVFIPQQISIGAMLNVAQREYVDQWGEGSEAGSRDAILAERTDLGEILNVNVQSLRMLKERVMDESTQLVECETLGLPFLKENHDKQTLMIYAKVNVFGDEWLGEYESGITHPLPDLQVCINFTPRDARPGDLLVNSGDRLTFYYCMNGLPGFLVTKAVPSADQKRVLTENSLSDSMEACNV